MCSQNGLFGQEKHKQEFFLSWYGAQLLSLGRLCVEGLLSVKLKFYYGSSWILRLEIRTVYITQSEMHISTMEVPSSSLNTHSSIINFHFETQDENNQKAIQTFILNPYKFYYVNTLISSIKSIVPFRRSKFKFLYKSFEVLV